MITLVKDPLTGCSVALGVLLLFFHIRAEAASLQRFQSWLLQALRNVILRHRSKKQLHGEEEEEAMKIQRMLDELRVQNFKMITRWICAICAIRVLYLVQEQEYDKYKGPLTPMLCFYAAFLFSSHSHVQWTPMGVTAFTQVLLFMMLVGTCAHTEWRYFLMNSSTRAMMRLVMGLWDMDHRRVAAWSFAFFIANTANLKQMSESLSVFQEPLALSQILVVEGTFCMFFWIVSYMTRMWATDGVRLALESSRSRIDKTMTDHLLSAFCDAQAKLGSDLQLLGLHEKLDQILMGRSPCRSELLHRESFLDYLAIADKARFKAFIEASSARSDQCASISNQGMCDRPKTLPSAIHVHLRDFSGCYHPASIFHSASMVSNGEPHHLIGICVDFSSEATYSAEQSTDSSASQDVHSKVPSSTKKSSISSRSSSSSGRSKSSIRLIDSPLIKRVSVEFDPLEWSIRKISWHLPDAGHDVPTIDACLLQPDSHNFRAWVQHRVNMKLFPMDPTSDEEGPSDLYGSMTLTLPRISCSRQNTIFAKSAWLDLEDLDDVDDGEYAMISLQLEGVQEFSSSRSLKAAMSTISE